MKTSRLFTVSSSAIYLFVFTLATLIIISSCKDDEPCIETIWYQDNDNDGRGNSAVSILDCEQPVGYVNNDIDDNDMEIFRNDLRFQESFTSSHLPEPYPVRIFVPGIFEINKNLPVIYLLDGKTYFEEVIEYTKDIDFDAIIVGIGEHTDNHIRARDFIPGAVVDGDGHLNFYQFLTEEVIPYIDQNYENDQTARTLIGHEIAGVFINFALLKGASENSYFQGYLSINPILDGQPELASMVDNLLYPPDTETIDLFLSQISATNFAEWFYLKLEDKTFPWLNMDEVYTVQDASNESPNPLVVEPSIKEGLKFIYDL
jgi:hypothetical protein